MELEGAKAVYPHGPREVGDVTRTEIPYEWKRVLEYLREFPNYSFRSTSISRALGMSSQKVSKILLQLSRRGFIARIERERRSGCLSPRYTFRK